MDSTLYIVEAMKTELRTPEQEKAMLERMVKYHREVHAGYGISTEGGEINDVFKRAIFYGTPVDRQNLIEEVGDVLWYLRIFCDIYGFTLEEAMDANIKKLADKRKGRYKDGFTETAAVVRDTALEMQALSEVTLKQV